MSKWVFRGILQGGRELWLPKLSWVYIYRRTKVWAIIFLNRRIKIKNPRTTVYETADCYISKPPAKFNCLHNSKPPRNQVHLENSNELSALCREKGKTFKISLLEGFTLLDIISTPCYHKYSKFWYKGIVLWKLTGAKIGSRDRYSFRDGALDIFNLI